MPILSIQYNHPVIKKKTKNTQHNINRETEVGHAMGAPCVLKFPQPLQQLLPIKDLWVFRHSLQHAHACLCHLSVCVCVRVYARTVSVFAKRDMNGRRLPGWARTNRAGQMTMGWAPQEQASRLTQCPQPADFSEMKTMYLSSALPVFTQDWRAVCSLSSFIISHAFCLVGAHSGERYLLLLAPVMDEHMVVIKNQWQWWLWRAFIQCVLQ